MSHQPTDKIALVLLNARGIAVAHKIQTAWPGAQIHGLASRVDGADETFKNIRECLYTLYREGIPVVGLCATGILGRTLAPLLSDKQLEPPVLAMSDDGMAIVPLFGGLTGANELARELANVTGGTATITASGARQFGLQLESPPEGYVLANPEDAKKVTSDLLSGKTACLEGSAGFLTDSHLPFTPDGDIPIRVTITPPPSGITGLIYHPRTVAVHLDPLDPLQVVCTRENIDHILECDLNIATGALGALFLTEGQKHSESVWNEVKSVAAIYNVPVRYISGTTGLKSHARTQDMDVLEAPTPEALMSVGRAHGDLTIVGLGPGDRGYLTLDARDALDNAHDLVGYDTYLDLVTTIRPDQTRHASGNRVEIERAEQALDLAAKGRNVALVTSGDPGIFAMASAVMEALEANPGRWTGLDVTTIPGISAMQTAAARIGAPLGHDFCTISLSDIRKPWQIVAQRLTAAARADFVIALYNPASKTRREQIHQAKRLLLEAKTPDTPVVLGHNLGRDGETVTVTTLGAFDPDTIDMRTVLIIGSSRTRTFDGPGGKELVYTPRTYALDDDATPDGST